MHWDETCKRLRDWSDSSAQAEALSRQIILSAGFTLVDPTHPRGGPDGKKDALCQVGEERWIMASYFPRGQKSTSEITAKFRDDCMGIQRNGAAGLAFVTNQEIPESVRKKLKGIARPGKAEIFHLDRLATALDQPSMSAVRRQFLGIADDLPVQIAMGGHGGQAPGAGGGGGAAIGPGARAGSGGPGGRILDAKELDVEALLAPWKDGRFPGAGGGGEAAIEPGSWAGNGGGGGDYLRTVLDMGLLQRLGIARFYMRVGKASEGRRTAQPTGYDLIDDRGNIIISVNAPAGNNGDVPTAQTVGPETEILVSQSTTRVQAAFLASSVELHDGLFSVLLGGWDTYWCDALPSQFQWPLVLHINIGGIRPGGEMRLLVVLIDPSGAETSLQTLQISRSNTDSNPYWTGALSLHPTITHIGRWIISIRSDNQELTNVPIDVKLRA